MADAKLELNENGFIGLTKDKKNIFDENSNIINSDDYGQFIGGKNISVFANDNYKFFATKNYSVTSNAWDFLLTNRIDTFNTSYNTVQKFKIKSGTSNESKKIISEELGKVIHTSKELIFTFYESLSNILELELVNAADATLSFGSTNPAQTLQTIFSEYNIFDKFGILQTQLENNITEIKQFLESDDFSITGLSLGETGLFSEVLANPDTEHKNQQPYAHLYLIPGCIEPYAPQEQGKLITTTPPHNNIPATGFSAKAIKDGYTHYGNMVTTPYDINLSSVNQYNNIWHMANISMGQFSESGVSTKPIINLTASSFTDNGTESSQFIKVDLGGITASTTNTIGLYSSSEENDSAIYTHPKFIVLYCQDTEDALPPKNRIQITNNGIIISGKKELIMNTDEADSRMVLNGNLMVKPDSYQSGGRNLPPGTYTRRSMLLGAHNYTRDQIKIKLKRAFSEHLRTYLYPNLPSLTLTPPPAMQQDDSNSSDDNYNDDNYYEDDTAGSHDDAEEGSEDDSYVDNAMFGG